MPAPVIKSGLLWLVAGVRSYLTAHSVSAKVACGFKARGRILTQGAGRANRIVFTPADDNGAGGRITTALSPGHRPYGGSTPQTREGLIRAIRDWQRICIVSVWSHDPGTPGTDEDAREAAELEASERLIEWTMRALHTTAPGDLEIGDVRWTFPDERSFGLEARIALTFRHPIFDVPEPLVRPTPIVTKNLEG